MLARPLFVSSLLGLFAVALLGADGPPDIAVPPGYKLLFTLHATGVQVYRATAGPAGLTWTLEGPLATLTDDGTVGYHYDGPTWESTDGSRIVRDPAEPVASAPAPHADRDIPWLRIKVERDGEAPGKFATTVYVQRTDTAGGKPPNTPPIRLGTKLGSPYTATYSFYGKAD